jgi:hypothetical protein
MPSITDWTRIEPRTRDEEMTNGLAARIHDPLWLLARQWQMGELLGEDGGSPIAVRVRLEQTPLARFHPGPLPRDGATGSLFDARRLPLETLVERETISREPEGGAARRFAVDAGLHFLRLLEQHGQGKYRQAYLARHAIAPPDGQSGTGLDPAALRFWRLMAGRVPDGLVLRAEFEGALQPVGDAAGGLPEQPPIAEPDRPAVIKAALGFLAWCDAFFAEPEEEHQRTWVDERMEYTFALGGRGASGEQVLTAEEYTEGILDWYTFDRLPGAGIGAGADPPGPVLARTAIPSPVTYRGMPAARWWEMEDAAVDFGAVEAAPEELARLLLVEFAVAYSNDWFLVPVTLPVGGLYRTRSLVVTDTFGERRLIRPYTEVDGPAAPWRLFHLSGSAEPDLLLASTLTASLEGRPLEEVLLLRDEMANLAWAVEHLISGPHGRPVNRHETEAARRGATVPAGETPAAPLAYHLATQVPVHWIPLAAVRDRPTDPLRLRRALLLRGGPEGLKEPGPLGRILLPGKALELQEEEVPRTGIRVTRAFQCARAADGSTHLWMGRRKTPGRGEGFSGLRFDVVEETGRTEEPLRRGVFGLARFDDDHPFTGE